MVYIRADGTVAEQKTLWRLILDFLQGIYDFIGLFVTALLHPGKVAKIKASSSNSRSSNRRLPSSSSSSNGGVRKSNIRGIKNIGLQGQGGCGGGG